MTTADTPWGQLLLQAFDQSTGVSGAAVSGAKLRQVLEKVAFVAGKDLNAELKASGVPFAQFALNTIQNASLGIHIVRRPKQDLLFTRDPSAIVSPRDGNEPGLQIRTDFYRAFTIMSGGAVAYDPTADQIVDAAKAPPDGKRTIPIPTTTIETEVQLRRSFLTAIGKEALLPTLEQSSPLYSFKIAIEKAGLESEWYALKTKDLKGRIVAWASLHELPLNPAWFRAHHRERTVDLRATLRGLVEELSDEQLKQVLIPLSAVVHLRK